MMNRKEVIKQLESFSGGVFITRKKLTAALGRKDPHSVDKYLRDLPRVDKELYFIPDVADALIASSGGRQ